MLKSIQRSLIVFVFISSINLFSQDYWINTEQLPIPPAASRLGLDLNGGLYVSTGDGNTYYSDNGGQDWQLIKSGLNVTIFLPDSTEYVYFGTDNGIYRSRGADTEWEGKSTGFLYYDYITDLVMDSNDNLYASVAGDGIYRSFDNGENWNFISYSIPLDNNYRIEKLMVNSQDTLFAGTDERGVYKSIDYGDNWFYTGLNELWLECATGLENDVILVGSFDDGIYRSDNTGNSWALSNSGLSSIRWITQLYQASDGTVYLAMRHVGIFRSTDHGLSWQLVSNDPIALDISDLLIDEGNNIIICGPNGVSFSDDDGTSWNPLNNGLFSQNIWIEDVFTGLGNKVFIYTRNGIYFSEDKGNNWVEWIHPAKDIAFTYASTDGTIYLLESDYYGSEGYQTNDGINWTPLNSHGFGYASDINENNMGVLYLCTLLEGPIMGTYFGGIFSSTDKGASWKRIGPDDNSYYAIAVNSNNRIFVGPASGNKGLLTSSNNGENWITIGSDTINSPARDILIDSNDHIFVGTDGGIFYSDSDGTSWEKIIQGLETVHVKSIVQNSEGDIFMNTQSEVYQYQPGNKSWEKISSGLSGADIRSIAIDNDDYLYLGYRKNIVARSVYPTVTNIGNPEEGLIATDFYLGPNYPNPFNPKTIINYVLPVTSYVELTIYNILGKKIALLVSEKQSAGHYEVKFNAIDLASGVYLYRIETDTWQDVKKMILLK